MIRLTVLAAAVACCSAFIVPPVALRSAERMEISKGVRMMTHSQEHSDVDEPYYPLGEVAVDRRTLLKAIPATAVAGKRRHGTRRLGKVRWSSWKLQPWCSFFVTADT